MNRKPIKNQRAIWLAERASGKIILCGICDDPITTGRATNRGGLSIDHIIPLSKGGQNVPSNMQPAHSKCNAAKGDKLTYDKQAIIRKVDDMIAKSIAKQRNAERKPVEKDKGTMTDRINALTVVLDHDYRDDDIDVIIQCIKLLKGVISVESNIADINDHIALTRAKQEFREKIYKALED